MCLQVLDVIEQMFTDIFKGVEAECNLELKAVGEQYPFEPFVMKPMRFTFAQGIKVRCSPRKQLAYPSPWPSALL